MADVVPAPAGHGLIRLLIEVDEEAGTASRVPASRVYSAAGY